MGSQYLISRKWALTGRFAITDEGGTPYFDARKKSSLARKLTVRDTEGTEVAVISRQGLTRRYRILAGGQETTVRPRGLAGRRFEIDSPAGPMEARGNFSGRRYAITLGGGQAASVAQLRTFRERFAVDVADGQDPVLMLAVVLVIETIRNARRSSAVA